MWRACLGAGAGELRRFRARQHQRARSADRESLGRAQRHTGERDRRRPSGDSRSRWPRADLERGFSVSRRQIRRQALAGCRALLDSEDHAVHLSRNWERTLLGPASWVVFCWSPSGSDRTGFLGDASIRVQPEQERASWTCRDSVRRTPLRGLTRRRPRDSGSGREDLKSRLLVSPGRGRRAERGIGTAAPLRQRARPTGGPRAARDTPAAPDSPRRSGGPSRHRRATAQPRSRPS